VPELDNLRTALDWALAHGDATMGIALAAASGPMWSELSLYREGRERLERAIALLDATAPPADEALLWLSFGELCYASDPARSVSALERAASMLRVLGDERRLVEALLALAKMSVFVGRTDDARGVLAEAWPLLGRSHVRRSLAQYYKLCGFVEVIGGDLAKARADMEHSLALHRHIGSGVAPMLLNLSDVTWALGDCEKALAGFREAIALLRERPRYTRDLLGVCLTNVAGVCTELGRLDEALAAAREGLPLRMDAGHAWGAMDHLALRAALAGSLHTAARLAGYADHAHAAMGAGRRPNEARAHARLHHLLAAAFPAGELSTLLDDGARLTPDDACRLALA
jgi:tetratricopeptide (TPR) repeat protein